MFFFHCREKKVLASSQDYGKDLPDVQNLLKKSQRLSGELKSHDPIIQEILEKGGKFKEVNPDGEEMIQTRCDSLDAQWKELNNLSDIR